MNDSPWKFWAALAAVVLVVGWGVWRWQRDYNDPAPDWLRQRTVRSPALPEPVLRQFLALRRAAEIDAREAQRPVGSIQFIEVGADEKPSVVWMSDQFVNKGFQPLAAFERPGGRDEKLFRGYYTLDGEPLEVTFKHSPADRNRFFLTVHLPEPLAPGAVQSVLRVDLRSTTVRETVKGDWRVLVGHLSGNTTAVQTRGVCLPAEAQVLQCRPADSALRLTESPTTIGWISTRLTDLDVTPSVIFRRAR